ncbi:MAG: PEGA domain-containing protein [Candidatus Paceibacterota bacterium]
MMKRKQLIAVGIVLLLTIGGILITKNVSVRTPLTVSAPYNGAEVYINEKRVGSIQNGTFTTEVPRGEHTVLVSSNGLFPWIKEVRVDTLPITVHPFLFAQNTRGVLITENDPEYTSLMNRISDATLPTREIPRTSPDGTINAFVEDEALIVAWREEGTPPVSFCSGDEPPCPREKQIVKPIIPITGVEFLDSWNEVLLFSTQTDIMAIEIDTRAPQNFQPLYRGTNIAFIPGEDNTLYIKDGNTLQQIIP